MEIINCLFQVFLSKYLNIYVSKIEAALDVRCPGSSPEQGRYSDLSSGTTGVGAACPSPQMDPGQGGQVRRRLRWGTKLCGGQKFGERNAVAPLILISPFLAPPSGLLHTHIHIHSVRLMHLHFCQKYTNFFTMVSSCQPRVIIK